MWSKLFGSISGVVLLLKSTSAGPLTTRISTRGRTDGCTVIPGDEAWPSHAMWTKLNSTIGGRLIASTPQAAICHQDGYEYSQNDTTACETLKSEWNFPATYESSASDIMSPYFQNRSCDPFYTNGECRLGNYVSYSIEVAGVHDIKKGIEFCKKHNVRFVIKNTGHDFLGKSTGKGGLSLWTWNMKHMELIENYSGGVGNYTGPAARFGAGVAGYDAIGFVGPRGYRIVSGDCSTVGFTGGYTQGGGHSFLNSEFGMAADQVLEWEVVTADGRHLTASPVENQDLYWALSGGGAGTFAVVVSVTVKVFPEASIGTASLSFNVSTSGSNETLVAALTEWWQFLPQLVDTGATVLWAVQPSRFFLESFTAANKTASQVQEMFAPYLSTLDGLNLTHTFSSASRPTYYDHYNISNGPLPYGNYPTTMLFNSRLIPRAVSESAERSKNLTVTMNNALDSPVASGWPGWGFGCHALNVANISHPDNAVTPHWRNAIAICIEIALFEWDISWADMEFRREYMTGTITPTMEAATPDGGAYLNEADPLAYVDSVEHWQQAFYGDTYGKLSEIKQRWDPEGLFYAWTAVGSEAYAEDAHGRICPI